MSIDASIPLQVQPLQIQSPLQTLQGLYALKNAGMQSQVEGMKLQEAQQQYGDNQAVRQAVRQNTTNNPDGTVGLNRAGVVSSLYQTAPTQALNLQTQFALQDQTMAKNNLELQQTQMKVSKDKVDLLGQLANGITDQDSYTAAAQQAVKLGLVHPGDLPATYDPQLVRQVQMNALTAKDHLDQQQKTLDFQLQQQNAQETARHNVITEGLTAQSQGETRRHDRADESLQAGSQAIQRTGQQITLRGQNISVENELRGQYNTTSQPFQKQSAAYNSVVTAAQQAATSKNPGTADINLLYGMLELYNPNGSPRPGALQKVEDTNSALGKLQLLYNKTLTGAQLTTTQRQQILQQAQDIYKTAETQQQQTVQSYRNIATRNGVNADNVAPEYRSVFSPQQAAEAQHQVGDVVTVAGKKIKITSIGANGKAQGVPVP